MKLDAITRPLSIEEIDFRVQSINRGGYATILAYKDARVDMKRLDEAFGIFGWQKQYQVINGNLFCGIGVKDPTTDNDWIWKWDVGVESNTEKEKGQASDAFKRACFNLGIGRELYDYPVIQFKLRDNEFTVQGDKVRPTWDFNLREWNWLSQFDKDNNLSYLGCADTTNELRWSWGTWIVPKATSKKATNQKEEAHG